MWPAARSAASKLFMALALCQNNKIEITSGRDRVKSHPVPGQSKNTSQRFYNPLNPAMWPRSGAWQNILGSPHSVLNPPRSNAKVAFA